MQGFSQTERSCHSQQSGTTHYFWSVHSHLQQDIKTNQFYSDCKLYYQKNFTGSISSKDLPSGSLTKVYLYICVSMISWRYLIQAECCTVFISPPPAPLHTMDINIRKLYIPGTTTRPNNKSHGELCQDFLSKDSPQLARKLTWKSRGWKEWRSLQK